MVSVNIAQKIIRKLPKNPACNIWVKVAANTGPGIIPPMSPKIIALII
jgi:hypothetical protein